jgi:hypothetical protein
MTDYYRNQYRSTPSRRVDGPVSMYPTRARRRRMVLLLAALGTAVVVVLGSLAGLVWGVKGLIGGPQAAQTVNTAPSALTGESTAAQDTVGSQTATGGDSGTTAAVATGSGLEVKSLLDLTAFRDAAYVPIKGVHVFVSKTRDKASMGRIMDIIDNSELNAMVVAVKEESGRVAYDSKAPMALEYGTAEPAIWGGDLDGLLSTLMERKIIPIARVVCFKDNSLTKKRPDLAILDKNTGKPWKDYK